MSGDLALDTIVSIGRALQESGDERLPIVEFVDEEELESSGSTET